jgi:putative oxidoreductase
VSYGILFLRLVLGGIMAAHGAQKLFGWFGGSGPFGTAAGYRQLNFRAPLLTAFAAGLAEFGGGLLLAVGLLTPLAALGIAVVMVNAIGVVHWRNGFWNSKGGYEFNLLIWAAAGAIAAIGAGRFSLDRLIGWEDNISGAWWGVGVLGLSLLVSAVTLTVGRDHGEHEEDAHTAGHEEEAAPRAA